MAPHVPSTTPEQIILPDDPTDEDTVEIDPTLSHCLCVKGTYYSHQNLRNLLCETCFVQISKYPGYPKGIRNYRHEIVLETEYKSDRCYHCKEEVLSVQAAHDCPMCISASEMAHIRLALNAGERISMISVKDPENTLTNSEEAANNYPQLALKRCGMASYKCLQSLLLCQSCYTASRNQETDENDIKEILLHQLLPIGVSIGMACMRCHESTLVLRDSSECKECIKLFMKIKYNQDHHFLTQPE